MCCTLHCATIVHCQCRVSRHPAVSSGVLAHGQPPTTRTQFARRGFCVTSSACSAPRRELLAGAVRTVSSRNSSATSPSSSTRNFAANHSNDWRWWSTCQSPVCQASRLVVCALRRTCTAPNAAPPNMDTASWINGARGASTATVCELTQPGQGGRREQSQRVSPLS